MDLTRINSVHNEKTGKANYVTSLYPYVDFLGLANRTGRDLQRNEKAYLIYLQLDQFIEMRDVLGINQAEQLLNIVRQRLQMTVSKIGIACHNDDGFFSLFLLDKLLKQPIHNFMEELTQALSLSTNAYNQGIYITCSYGICTFPDHGKTVEDCLEKAKVALTQENKILIRDLKIEYNNKMTQKMKKNFLTEMSLRKGLEQEQFELYYQPQMDSVTGKLIGLEGLIRWHHPEEGVKMPGSFLELAESTGLIFPIGEWVIEQAFNQLENWKKQGEDTLTISINISSRHFLAPSFQPFLERCLQKYDIKAEQLIIEITEDVAIEDLEVAKKRILALRTYGFQVSIDDFGTGFSAFHYLQHFPVQEIKIDRQFIQDITQNEVSMRIAKSIIDLANMLKLKVVCEGVETAEQCEILQQIGTPILQGYYFSKPMRYQDVCHWWEETKNVAYPSNKK